VQRGEAARAEYGPMRLASSNTCISAGQAVRRTTGWHPPGAARVQFAFAGGELQAEAAHENAQRQSTLLSR
jgi:hypothetical protein